MNTFVDLFSGAGGLSLGLVQAGWKCLVAIDSWDDAVKTYRLNFPDHEVLHSDVSMLSGSQILGRCGEKPQWIVGGPPCQGFSTIGKRLRSDPRNSLFREFLRIVTEIEPDGVLIENVLGLKDMNFIGEIGKAFSAAGYRITPMVLVAADFGVPQLRRRVFFVGTRRDLQFIPPPPAYSPANYVTVWDAIGDLPKLGPGEKASKYDKPAINEFQRKMRAGSKGICGHEVSKHPDHLVRAISFIPDGGNRQSIPEKYQPKSGFHNSYSRLHSASPAVAVTQNMGKPSGTRCIHPFQNRGLTAREGARLQTFPDRFKFVGGITSQRLQIANAVPPLLAKVIGETLERQESWTLTDLPNI
jgi:DNA (cytosine-5)-methyltransferase 1